MYVHEEDYENYELVLSSSDPREVMIYEANDKDVLVPSFVRVTKSMPVPGKKITITVADNGYVVTQGSKTKIATDDWDSRLDNAMKDFLNADVESERDLHERELEDADLPTYNLKMNTSYKSKQKRGE